jgi:glucuronate isomerase
MAADTLAQELFREIQAIPLIDPHTHIDPHSPPAKSLDDILGYHYYTELAHSAGMDKGPLAPSVPPQERVKAVLSYMDRYDNTAQYSWFLEICQTFLGFQGTRVTAADADALWSAAERRMSQPDWEHQVLKLSGLEAVFLTNEFDDPLVGFDTARYVPCLRTDDLVFKLDQPSVKQRLTKATGIEPGDAASLRKAVAALFTHFTKKGARACAISLPPNFSPSPVDDTALSAALKSGDADVRARGVFWMLAEHCREFNLPFDLMIGVNRRVYREGVYQGQDLFDNRTSLMLYAELFNAFPSVPFCVSVLSSGLNQELCSFAWIFPNVITSGHWWYANVPAFIEPDLRARLQAVPKTKQIGYYSDMYKLEFGLPKFNMYRRVLAKVLADDFVRTGALSADGAVALARAILRDNVRRLFRI